MASSALVLNSKRADLGLALLAITLTFGGRSAAAAQYFVDCADGNDGGDASSPGRAWKTLDKVSAHQLLPGDELRFKRGTKCRGMLWPKGSGVSGAPITLGSYGLGALPVIQSDSQHKAAFRLFNQEYWEIQDLEFSGGEPFGVWISGDRGILHHIHLKDLVVHDVTGGVKAKESGLVIISPGAVGQHFDDVLVDGITAFHTSQWAGILVGGGNFGFPPESTRNTNVIIRNSTVYDVQGDGIILFRVNHGLIEKSVAWNTGMQVTQTIGTPNAIWTWECGECAVQYNEAFLTDSPGVDGGAFDIDYGNRNNTVQYNYGHDTQGYCVAVFGAGFVTKNSVVRGNTCVDNGFSPRLARYQGAIFLLTWNGGKLSQVTVENNTIAWNPSIDAPAIRDGAEFIGPPGILRNNVICSMTTIFVANNGTLQLEANHFEHVDSQQELKICLSNSKVTTENESSYPDTLPSLAAYPGKWVLLAMLDDTPDSRSQTVVLKSAEKQFAGNHLEVMFLRGRPTDAYSVPATLLVSPGRKVVRHWEGFVPPAELGLALREHIGAPDYAEMGK